MKICTRCKEEKSLECFPTRNRPQGLRIEAQCKKCISEIQKQNSAKNAKRISAYHKLWRIKNKEYEKQKGKEYRKKNKEKITKKYYDNKEFKKEGKRVSNKKSYEKHKIKRAAQGKTYREKNKNKIKEKKKEYVFKNKETLKEKKRIYNINNRSKINASRKIRTKKRRDSDILYRTKCNIRKRTWEAFKRNGYPKNGTTEQILGAPFEIIKLHIERLFTKGMKWNNYGEWHIDHKIPLISAKTKEDVILLCHYTNLQPLWGIDNLKKHGKILPTQIILAL